MKTVKIKKISGMWHVFCLGCKKWIGLILFKKQDNALVCVICGFVINQNEQKWQFCKSLLLEYLARRPDITEL